MWFLFLFFLFLFLCCCWWEQQQQRGLVNKRLRWLVLASRLWKFVLWPWKCWEMCPEIARELLRFGAEDVVRAISSAMGSNCPEIALEINLNCSNLALIDSLTALIWHWLVQTSPKLLENCSSSYSMALKIISNCSTIALIDSDCSEIARKLL